VGDAVFRYEVVDIGAGLRGVCCGFAVLLLVAMADSGIVWSAESVHARQEVSAQEAGVHEWFVGCILLLLGGRGCRLSGL
jgi:hypothetical protein